jgi:hypothetical protein
MYSHNQAGKIRRERTRSCKSEMFLILYAELLIDFLFFKGHLVGKVEGCGTAFNNRSADSLVDCYRITIALI